MRETKRIFDDFEGLVCFVDSKDGDFPFFGSFLWLKGWDFDRYELPVNEM